MNTLCRDCGCDTGNAQYMIPDDLWVRSGMAPTDQLCRPCLERRVGPIADTEIKYL